MSIPDKAVIESLMVQIIEATPVEKLKALAFQGLEEKMKGKPSFEQIEHLADQLDAAKKLKARREAVQAAKAAQVCQAAH